ncbi:hypothetical protein Tco_0801474 [Tanacetum coccineum]|uniref:Uncharacterized protein n=1 Tax=Tanacetum coccineum TaxID=301880 RepID=A0ABQ4ZYY9_9ASTR
MKVEESLNVIFDESPPPSKLSPLVDDDVGEEEAIIKNTKVVNNNNEEDESIELTKMYHLELEFLDTAWLLLVLMISNIIQLDVNRVIEEEVGDEEKWKQGCFYLYLLQVHRRLKDVASFLAAAAEEKKNKHMVPSFLTMEWSKLLGKLL